jgi:hypothetical protein
VYTNRISKLQLRVLVVHAFRPTTRQTTLDFVSSFARHLPNSDVQFVNVFQPKNVEWKALKPDVLVVNYDVLNYRFSPLWKFLKGELKDIAMHSGFRILLAQDDFWANELLDDWIIENNIDRVLTPIENNLEILYPRSYRGRDFQTVLTGYVNESQFDRYSPKRYKERGIDLGQRVRYPSANLGKYGQEKAIIAERLANLAADSGFITDVSTDVNDSKSGQSWIDFLCDTRFTVSMKGGASLNDPKGLLYMRTSNYLARNPKATFEEISGHCLSGLNEEFVFSAISPRLFEAAQARTCQILIESDYLGLLEPWVHYIPLKSDFSNSAEVLAVMKDHEKAEQIANACYEALINSGEFTDHRLVEAAMHDLPKFEQNRDLAANKAWRELVEHQQDLARIQEEHSPELSDTLVLWLHDKWMRGGKKALKSVKKMLLSPPHSLDELISTDQYLLKLVQDKEIVSWVVSRIDEMLTRRSYKRLVWPWRMLPGGELHSGNEPDSVS